jgi:hypothetical protein
MSDNKPHMTSTRIETLEEIFRRTDYRHPDEITAMDLEVLIHYTLKPTPFRACPSGDSSAAYLHKLGFLQPAKEADVKKYGGLYTKTLKGGETVERLKAVLEPKTEVANVTEDTAAAVVLMEAMLSKSGKCGELLPEIDARLKEKADRRMWKVKLTVDGIEIPVMRSLQEVWDRENTRIEERALKRAKEMVSEAGLAGVMEALDSAKWKIENALEEKFGKDNNDA